MLFLAIVIFWSIPISAEPGFDEKYQRDYNIFNPINQYRPDNPLNPINEYNPNTPFKPLR
ncbi:MAG: hypothetical protein EPO61_00475 [Nitrospirae bacterium]|nr:MAG: hypothetical protein EPO61_00475 [Nitrospirota bacterium]